MSMIRRTHSLLRRGAPAPTGTTEPTMGRRRFLGWAAVGGVAAATGVAAMAFEPDGGSTPIPGPSATPARRPPSDHPTATDQSLPNRSRWRSRGSGSPSRPAIIAENARTGDAWWVTTPQNAGDIEGYADQVSAQVGDDRHPTGEHQGGHASMSRPTAWATTRASAPAGCGCPARSPACARHRRR